MIDEEVELQKTGNISPPSSLRYRKRARRLGVQNRQLEMRAGGILAMFYRSGLWAMRTAYGCDK